MKTKLQQIHSDLLFSVKTQAWETLLHVIFEHQSTPDPIMPLRLLGYTLEILNQHHKAHGLPLPPVIPFVFHQGPEIWKVTTRFENLFDLPPAIAGDLLPFLPKFEHALLDLSRFDPAAEEIDFRLQVILQLMKLAREQHLLRFFQWLAETHAQDLSESLLGRLLLYALHTDSGLDVETIYRSLATNPELEKRAMSIAEKLRTQGRSEGLSEGLSEGRLVGYWIGKIQMLEEFLDLPVTPTERMENQSPKELESRHGSLREEYEKRFKRR